MDEMEMIKSKQEAAAGWLVGFFICIWPMILWSGVVLSWLWFWFVVPTLFVPAITWWQGAGLAVFVMWLKIGTQGESKNDHGDGFIEGFTNCTRRFFRGAALHAAVFGIAYVFHAYG